MSKKFLYLFKEGHDAFGGDQTTMKNTLGGKGAGLAEMTHAGMPVPQGFTITTEACTQYYADNREINDEIKADIFKYMGILEEQTGKTFGSIENPLLVSVRSGARQSMPGMMDTILNLGLNDEAVEGLAKKTNTTKKTPTKKTTKTNKLLRVWPKRPTTPVLPTTATAASSRCTLTSSWSWARASSRSASTL